MNSHKIAITGKGGSGKTAITAIMAGVLAREGKRKILCIDADSSVSLSYALGKEVKKTGEMCEQCGKDMVIRSGRFGRFVACSGFPACRNTKPLSTGVSCPEANCDGYLVQRRGRGRRKFYGCSNYPRCGYITNQLSKEKSQEAAEEKPPEADEVDEDV